MSEKLLVPDIGDFEEVEVIEILVKQGDQIKENDPVVTIESDKSSVEIPSTISGKIESIAIKVGDKVSKDDLLLNVLSSNKSKDDKPIPKDTESIIKQAEASACLMILSVSFGIGLSSLLLLDDRTFKSKSSFETLSPTLIAILSILPEIVDGISTLDLSLSIVTTGSFSFI